MGAHGYGLDGFVVREFARQALKEDLSYQDVTTQMCVDAAVEVEALIIGKEASLIVCGLEVAAQIFKVYDPHLEVSPQATEGSQVTAEAGGGHIKLLRISGKAQSILAAERTVLNVLARMSGVATYTHKLVRMMSAAECELLDTRKTMPMLKVFDKYAARVGGARNHRFGLSDGILIKENHILACGGLKQAIALARRRAPVTLKIEVEVRTLAECREALAARADLIMLDNMSLEQMRACVAWVAGQVPLEASGNMTVDRIAEVAQCGVDFISTSAMFKAPPVDLSLMVQVSAGKDVPRSA